MAKKNKQRSATAERTEINVNVAEPTTNEMRLQADGYELATAMSKGGLAPLNEDGELMTNGEMAKSTLVSPEVAATVEVDSTDAPAEEANNENYAFENTDYPDLGVAVTAKTDNSDDCGVLPIGDDDSTFEVVGSEETEPTNTQDYGFDHTSVDYIGGSRAGNVLKQLDETKPTPAEVIDAVPVKEDNVYFVGPLQSLLSPNRGLQAGRLVTIAYSTAEWEGSKLADRFTQYLDVQVRCSEHHATQHIERDALRQHRLDAIAAEDVAFVFIGYDLHAFSMLRNGNLLDNEADVALVVHNGTIRCNKFRGAFEYNAEPVAF